jgi:hypothetical protein
VSSEFDYTDVKDVDLDKYGDVAYARQGIFCVQCGKFIGFDPKLTPMPEKDICIPCIIRSNHYVSGKWKIINFIIDYDNLYSKEMSEDQFLYEQMIKIKNLLESEEKRRTRKHFEYFKFISFLIIYT